MRPFYFNFFLCIVLLSCQDNKVTSNSSIESTPVDSPIGIDSLNVMPDTVTQRSSINSKQKLALTSNALQIVDGITGSTKEVPFGMAIDKLVPIVTNMLHSGPLSDGVNSECGAGPLKMVLWTNGLTLVFQETKKGNGNWLFAGWFAGKPTTTIDRLMTMAGVGVGSSREELESAYVIKVNKTTLGVEFSVNSGFYGLLSGEGKQATIEVMWSGTSCNFR